MKRQAQPRKASPVRRVAVSESQAAVDDYLDTLLFEATEAAAPAGVSPAPVVKAAEAPQVEPPVECDELPTQAALVAPISQAEQLEPARQSPPVPEEIPEPEPEKARPAMPAWAESGFQCLQFDLGGWRLAAPLVGFQRILGRRGKLHRVPGAAPWELGLYEHGEGRARVVNLSRLMGGSQKNDEEFAADAHLLLLADGYWACLCDRIGDVSWLSGADIQWSLRDERRPWEVGVVRDSLRTLVDPERLARQLTEGVAGR